MKRMSSIRSLPVLLPFVLAGGLAAQEAADSPLPPSDLDMPVSIQALMISMIDPAAHYLWDYASGNRALGEGQWTAVEHVATQLAAAGPLIRLGGTGEDDPLWTTERNWILFARAMQSAALEALEAARSRDTGLLAEASARLVDACDGCHQAYRPSLGPEGQLHDPASGGLYRSEPQA